MLTILAIAQNDLACYAKNRMAIFWTFLGPAVCMWFFGFLNPLAPAMAPIRVISNSHSQLATSLITALRRDGHTVTESAMSSAGGLSVEVQPDGIVLHTGASETAAERSLRYELQAELSAKASSPVTVSAPPRSANGFQRTVPAYLIMFLTMNLLMSGAGFAQERANGRMRRLLTAPVPALSVIAGRLASRLIVAWLQMLVLFSVGVFVLQIHWAAHTASLILLLSLYVLAMGSIGILIGTCFHDPDHASGFAMWTALILAPLTGLWWPIELMPHALQTLSHLLPTGWVMQSVNSMLSAGASPAEFRLTFLGLFAVAAVAVWISASRLAQPNSHTAAL
jgi:ABC-type multidrug transport system permease subunit